MTLFLGWGQSMPRGAAPSNALIGTMSQLELTRGTKVSGEILVPLPLRPLWIPHGIFWEHSQAFAIRSHLIMAYSMAHS